MPRQARAAPGGYVYHALNRAVARLLLFQKPADYDAFERVLVEALVKHPIRLLAYCVMPNHWHFVLWPETDEQLTEFLRCSPTRTRSAGTRTTTRPARPIFTRDASTHFPFRKTK